jgi:hypothetical protein
MIEKQPFVDSPRWSTGRHTDPWFQRRFHTKWSQRVAKAVAIVAVVGIVCTALAMGLDRASAVEPTAPAAGRQVFVDRQCVMPGGDPCPPPARFARDKFRHGKMGHANHPTKWLFKNPRAVKAVIRHKIERRLARVVARHPHARVMSVDHYMHALWSDNQCEGQGSYQPYSYGFDVCNFAGPSPLTTKEQVQQSGAVVLCGAGVAMAWADGAGIYALGLMGTTCAWSFWMGFDN